MNSTSCTHPLCSLEVKPLPSKQVSRWRNPARRPASTQYKYYAIYQTTCKVNGKIYIGQHRTNNLDDTYLGSGTFIKEDIKRYGRDAFEKKILFVFDNFDEMNEKEKELVTPEFVAREDTYNRIIGGQLDDHEARKLGALITYQKKIENGTVHATWWKHKSKDEIQAILKRRTDTCRRKYEKGELHGSMLGKHHSSDTREKISIAKRGTQVGCENPKYGQHWWKHPTDKTQFGIFKDGDAPQGWVHGSWVNEDLKVVKTCNYCGAKEGLCEHPEICSRPQLIKGLRKLFGDELPSKENFYGWFFHRAQQLLTWHYADGLSGLEIAKKLNKGFSSVYSCMSTLKKLLA